MDKSQLKFLLLAIVLAVVAGGFLLFMDSNNKLSNDDNTVVETPNTASKYQSVQVGDGTVAFTFEVPKDWLVETRNDGEKPMNEEELREFLATAYQEKNPRDPNKQVSDYAHLAWSDLEKMTLSDMRQFMVDREKSVGPYPNASVSGRPFIWYTDGNAYQIDFYITDYQKAEKDIASLQSKGLKFSEEVVAGVKAQVEQYAVEYDEDGNPQPNKFLSGGKMYYILLPVQKKALLIEKQMLGDTHFEEAFAHLLQTLKFETAN